MKYLFLSLIITTLMGVILIFLYLTLPFSSYSSQLQINKTDHTYHFGNLKENFKKMQEDQVIYQDTLLLVFLKFTRYERKIQQGTYEFNSGMSPLDILRQLTNGKVKRITITIPEGFDLYDIAALLEKNHITPANKFIQLTKSPKVKALYLSSIYHIIKNIDKTDTNLDILIKQIPNIEGFVYPDTYSLTLNQPLSQFFDLSSQNFYNKIIPIIKKNKKKVNWLNLFTIASLIEKETQLLSEKPLVSSVIYNRIKKKMKLRIDPTVIYTLKKLNLVKDNLKEGVINIQKKHFYIPSPYNTYYTKKLPPAPISSFSVTSLEAALHPATTDYLFFMAKTKGELKDGHSFSTTYKEHLQNIKKFYKK